MTVAHEVAAMRGLIRKGADAQTIARLFDRSLDEVSRLCEDVAMDRALDRLASDLEAVPLRDIPVVSLGQGEYRREWHGGGK